MCANGCVLVIARVQNGVVYLTTHSVCLSVCMYVLSMCVDIFRFLALDIQTHSVCLYVCMSVHVR